MTGVLCKLCLMYGNPLRSGGLTLGNMLKDDEELFEHIEIVHCLPVAREGETKEQAKERVKRKNPKVGTDQCTCPHCMVRRMVAS